MHNGHFAASARLGNNSLFNFTKSNFQLLSHSFFNFTKSNFQPLCRLPDVNRGGARSPIRQIGKRGPAPIPGPGKSGPGARDQAQIGARRGPGPGPGT